MPLEYVASFLPKLELLTSKRYEARSIALTSLSPVSLARQFPRFPSRASEMNSIFFLILLLAFIAQIYSVNGGQVALRSRRVEHLVSRSILSDASIFDPTNEEVFYAGGGENGPESY